MAIKVSKYIIRMMNAKKGIIPNHTISKEHNIKQSIEKDIDVKTENHNQESFEEWLEYTDLLYLGHFEKSQDFLYVATRDIFILKLLNIFEEQYLSNDLKTVDNATDSKFKTLKGIPLNKYEEEGYQKDYKTVNISEISQFIPHKDLGNSYSLRIQVDDGSNFIAYNNLTAIYYFHGNTQSVKDYLSYFSVEEQLINLENTIARFEKDLSMQKFSKFDNIRYNIAQNFLPFFHSILLEKQLELTIPLNNKTNSTLKF